MQSSETCSYGNLTPRGQNQRASNIPTSTPPRDIPTNNSPTRNTPTTNAPAASVQNTPNSSAPNTAFTTAVLDLSTGFAGQAPNPLGGRELIVLNQSWEDVLRKAGFQDPAGPGAKRSAVAIWAAACKEQSPRCKQGIDAMQGSFVHKIRLDQNGRARISGVPKGNYWIVGLGVANNQHYVWNVPMAIDVGPNHIVFDPRNVTIIY